MPPLTFITCILAVSVALMSLLYCMLFYAIGRKDERLAKLADEISTQKDVILELELELQRNSELIRTLTDGQRTDGE